MGTLEWFDEIEAIRREQSGDAPIIFDIRALVDDYKQTAGWRRQAENTTVSYDSALKPILSRWGYRRVSDIAVSDVVSLVEHLADHPAAANMTLVMIRKLMKYAVQKGLRADNPAREVDTLDEAEDGAKPITPAAWAALRDPACPVAVHRLGVLGRYTGQRISDLITMRPCDRDEDGISHKIKKLKNRPHWSFLTPEQAAEVDGWNAPGGLPYMVKPDGSSHTTDSLRHAWNGYARTDLGAALRGFTPHDLRATKVCDERIAGKTHQQIAAMVGMSIQKVMHYSKHIDQRQAARGTSVPSVRLTDPSASSNIALRELPMDIQAELTRIERRQEETRRFADEMNRRSARLAEQLSAMPPVWPYIVSGVILGAGIFGLGFMFGRMW